MDDDEQQKKLLEALRDDVDFQQKLTKLYEDHARSMVRIKSMPPPTEEQKQKIAEVIAE